MALTEVDQAPDTHRTLERDSYNFIARGNTLYGHMRIFRSAVVRVVVTPSTRLSRLCRC